MKHASLRARPSSVLALALLALTPAFSQTSWDITSPGGNVRGTVQLADLSAQVSYPAGSRLYYNVSVGGPSFAEATPPAPLGITRQDESFVDGLVFDSASAPIVIDETYSMVTGKRRVIRNNANERSLYFHNANGARLKLVVRAYDDGFAFRYVFPETNSASFTVTGEATGFRVPASSTGWMMPHQAPAQFAPGYEDTYRQVTSGANSPNADGWSLPATFKTPTGVYVMIGETDVTPNYAGTRLQQSSTNSVYRIRLPNPAEGNNTGSVNPVWTLPWEMPWRFVIAGTNPGVVLESAMPTNLASPSKVADVSWIKPGRSSWSWYSAEASPRTYSQMLPFYDLAQQMTWEYHLVDATWDRLTGGTMANLIAYGKARNVETLVWYNGGGPNNTLSATDYGPRDILNDSALRQTEFQKLKDWGVKGIKVDFFQSDKQNIIKYYHDLMRDAAKYNLMINFHGCTIQRGWQRTYPNLMTTESVKGAEMYKYDGGYPAGQPSRNTMLPFTRNVMGGMDYTPVTFTQYANKHLTSSAHELALTVVFESGLLHLADKVAGYTARPDSVKAFLRGIPTVWDETKYLQGEPGTHLVVARRKGQDWWVGGVNGQNATRAFSQPLTFLGAGNYALLQIADSTVNDSTFTFRTRNVGASDTVSVSARAYGGFALRLVRLDGVGIRAPGVGPRKAGNILFDTRYYDVIGRRLVPDPVTGKLGPVKAAKVEGK
jgi:alpha-glucosidase